MSKPGRSARRGRGVRGFVVLALILVLAAAAQRGLVALGVLHLGGEPLGQSRFYWVAGGAAPALLACGLLLFVGSLVGRVGEVLGRWWPAALLPVAGALFAVAAFFSYDPYYLPHLWRFSAESVPVWWIAPVAPLCAVACLAVLRAGRPGLAVGGVALWWCLVSLLPVGWH